MTKKPVVFLSSDHYIVNNPNPQNRQITDNIYAECLIDQADLEEFWEWSGVREEPKKWDLEDIETLVFSGALLLFFLYFQFYR